MRFKRFGTYAFEDTPRKRAALLRKQRAECDALPLFADQIAEAQESVDDAMAARATLWDERQQADRQHRAAEWHRARARLAAYPQPVRHELLAYWQRCKWPADPSYLLSMLHMHDNGRLELHPVYPSAAELEATRVAGAARSESHTMTYQSVTVWQANDYEVEVRYGLFSTPAEAAGMGCDGINGIFVDGQGLWIDRQDGTRAPVCDGSFTVRRLREGSRAAASWRALTIDDFECIEMSTEAMRREPAMWSFGSQSYGVIDAAGRPVILPQQS